MGLSSHTATAVNDETVIVVGREGGVREQRRFGDVFLLRVDIERKSYFYEEAPFKIDSRSGHTAAVLSSSVTGEALMIFGGRQSEPCQGIVMRGLDMAVEGGLERRSELLLKLERLAKPVKDMKRGLRHHAMLQLCSNSVMIHGGENFMARENVSDNLYLVKMGPRLQIEWFRIEVAKPLGRCGHCLFAQDDKIFAVGGIGRDGKRTVDWVTEIELG